MSVNIRLINSRDDSKIGDFDFAAVPAIGSQVMVLDREWGRWGVDGVVYWPSNEHLPDDQSLVCAYVSYGGDLE
jgi:hypothetical protein